MAGLNIRMANKTFTGNQICDLQISRTYNINLKNLLLFCKEVIFVSTDSASVVVHVLNGERPAAMQSDAPQKTSNTLILLTILPIRRELTDIVLHTLFAIHINFQNKLLQMFDNIKLISR